VVVKPVHITGKYVLKMFEKWVDCRSVVCDGVRLPSQHCGLGPVVLSPGDNDVSKQVDKIS
jgi:hypothetical protein